MPCLLNSQLACRALPLKNFIIYTHHRTKSQLFVNLAALYLLQCLKTRSPARPSSIDICVHVRLQGHVRHNLLERDPVHRRPGIFALRESSRMEPMVCSIQPVVHGCTNEVQNFGLQKLGTIAIICISCSTKKLSNWWFHCLAKKRSVL